MKNIRNCHQSKSSEESQTCQVISILIFDSTEISGRIDCYLIYNISYLSKSYPNKWKQKREGWWNSQQMSTALAWTRIYLRQQWTKGHWKDNSYLVSCIWFLPWWRSRPWRRCWRPGPPAGWCSLPKARTAPRLHYKISLNYWIWVPWVIPGGINEVDH